MLLKVHEVVLDYDFLINLDNILYIKDNKVYFTPNCYMEVRQIDITNIRKNMKWRAMK